MDGNTISVLGSIASIVGMPVMIWQIVKTRRVTRAVQLAIDDTRKDVQRTMSILDVSKHLEAIKLIQDSLIQGKYDVSLIRMRDLRDVMIDITNTPILAESNFTKALRTKIIVLGSDIETIIKAQYKQAEVDYTLVIKNLDNLSTILCEVRANLKHKSL